jgi:hypothetical protein
MEETPIDESVMVEVLCKSSKEFEQFYREEKQKYNLPIEWIWKPDLKEGDRARASIVKSKTNTIYKLYFRNYPKIDDPLVFAHEIEHLIRFVDGKPLLIKAKDKNNSNIATDLMSMLEDSVVDSILQEKYNFDLLPVYKKSLKLPKKELKTKREPIEDLLRLASAIRLCNWKLRWNLIKDQNSRTGWVNYLRAYRLKSRNTWNIYEDLQSIIQKNGLETNEKQERIFVEFVEHFKGLGDILVVVK